MKVLFFFVSLEFIAPQSGEKYWKDLMSQKKKMHIGILAFIGLNTMTL